jgi:hypothetical protein
MFRFWYILRGLGAAAMLLLALMFFLSIFFGAPFPLLSSSGD